MASESDQQFSLVMPFVSVQSKGGPYEDHAFAAGYEMGLLDARLQTVGTRGSLAFWEATIRVANREQADLIAMRHGYLLVPLSEQDGWLDCRFVPESRSDTPD